MQDITKHLFFLQVATPMFLSVESVHNMLPPFSSTYCSHATRLYPREIRFAALRRARCYQPHLSITT